MFVQAGLCKTCLETTLLVFPRGGSFILPMHLLLSNQSLACQGRQLLHKALIGIYDIIFLDFSRKKKKKNNLIEKQQIHGDPTVNRDY